MSVRRQITVTDANVHTTGDMLPGLLVYELGGNGRRIGRM